MTENTVTVGERDVVVGVDGTPASVNAVRYALREAAATGGRVRLVHVMPEYEAFGSPFLLPDAQLRITARAIVQDVLDQAGTRPEGLEVDLVLRRGPRVPTLCAVAASAQLLVIGADRRSIASRLVNGNTTAALAASSSVPVVAVPETWRSEERGSAPVLVGVKNPTHAVALLGAAFATAQRRGGRLLVLHAWKLDAGYDDVVAGRVDAAEWEERALAEMRPLVAPFASAHPEVHVELRVVHDQAAHALVEASRASNEIVLVRRAHGVPAALHLGATARTVLRAGHCPVRVVPPGLVTPEPDLVLEDAGGIRK